MQRVRELAMNLWWTWNPDAQRLFASIDPILWEATHHNPIATLELLSTERRGAIESDRLFADHLGRVEQALQRYLSARTWFARTARGSAWKILVAYFCAEFAVHESLPQYSGGLGVLAGDHLKSASDLGVPLVGVGLLYQCGFYRQQLNADGSTRVIYPVLDFTRLPITDTQRTIDVPMGRRSVRARIWCKVVGRTAVYLLDTDIAGNSASDRALTRHLYGGDREYRIRQEILLGVGGVLALRAMRRHATVFHLNEGHAAFATLQRLRQLVQSGRSFEQASRIVRASSVFTTHTPVPAGNDRFSPALTMKYLKPLERDLGLTREQLLALGREDPSNRSEEFCMTVLALKLCGRCNGVARLHGQTSRRMWTGVFNTDNPSKVPIGHVTNGIHSQTWLAPEMHGLYDRYLKPDWVGAAPGHDPWKRAGSIPPQRLWSARRGLRQRLIRFVRQRLVEQTLRRHGSLDELILAQTALDPDVLTIGFARRFATYKRGDLIFHDARRLARILGDPKRPVQLVFAGKAHPADMGGQRIAQRIFRHSGEPRFRGRVVVLEDYDMEVGRMLTSGCDVWLNNPLRPQEASGTSGMKPPLHGGINCSILDGWWPEGFNRRNGWAISAGRFDDSRQQDQHDAETIYTLLESRIVPEFYQRDRQGVPRRWVRRMIESMRSVCAAFSSHRMVGQYTSDYYLPAHRGVPV
jgi:starch phosphorylase